MIKLSIDPNEQQEGLLIQVRELFSTILQFRDAVVRVTQVVVDLCLTGVTM
jgi:hypothetical protein